MKTYAEVVQILAKQVYNNQMSGYSSTSDVPFAFAAQVFEVDRDLLMREVDEAMVRKYGYGFI